MAKSKPDPQELQGRLNALKQLLNNSDYQAIKAFEGVPSDSWEQIRQDRDDWRQEVRTIEAQLEEIENEA